MSNRILLLVVCCGLVASASAQFNLDHLTYNAGGGIGLGRNDVSAFVGNSGQVEAGVGFKLNRLFSVDAEYMYYNLGFKETVKLDQALVGQKGHMQSISLDGIVDIPKHVGKFAGYGIFGIGFYDRTVSVPRHFLQAGTEYQPSWLWWDLTWVNNLQFGQLNPQYISSNSKVAGGFNCGGGITYRLYHHSDTASKLRNNAKLYVEWRYHRAYQSDGKTIVMPITVGFRW